MPRKLLLIAGLMFATTMLTGCVIVPGDGYHHGWWGWHHRRDWDDR